MTSKTTTTDMKYILFFATSLLTCSFVQSQGIRKVADQIQVGYNPLMSEPNQILYVKENDAIGISGSLDSYGYRRCVETFAVFFYHANLKYGEANEIQKTADAPTYVNSIDDYNNMNVALSLGSANVDVIYGFTLNKKKTLVCRLVCNKDSYVALMYLVNTKEIKEQ